MIDDVTLRVRLHEAWDDINIAVPPQTTVGELKQQVLTIAGDATPPGEFAVKFRGVELRDEQQSVADARIPDGAALIVLRRRRRAVR